MFCKKNVLENFTKPTGKRLCQSFFFNKVARLRPATLSKKKLWHRCFPVSFVKFLRTPFLQNTSGGWFWSFVKSMVCLKNILTTYKIPNGETHKKTLKTGGNGTATWRSYIMQYYGHLKRPLAHLYGCSTVILISNDWFQEFRWKSKLTKWFHLVANK